MIKNYIIALNNRTKLSINLDSVKSKVIKKKETLTFFKCPLGAGGAWGRTKEDDVQDHNFT